MASPPRPGRLPQALLLLLPLLAAADLVLEDGYTVTTAADLSRHPAAHPYAILPRPRAGDLVLLDSAASTLYALALPTGDLRRLAGGKRDAPFDRPRSLAVDAADNVYVADRLHGAVRKVAPSGFTTTIAGGLSSGNGHRDGPAQNATFSPDFELVYVPKLCALLLADRGNRLIRQINLKPQDCAYDTQTGLGTTSVSIIAVLCALFGSVMGFLARHFYPIHGVSINRFFSRIQKQYRRTLRKVALISFCDIKSAVANSMFCTLLLKLVRVSLGYLTMVFASVRSERRIPRKLSPCLDSHKTFTTPKVSAENKALPSTERLGEFISFDEDASGVEDNETDFRGIANSKENKEPSFDGDFMGLLQAPLEGHKKIDHMIDANLSDFSGQGECRNLTVSSHSVSRRKSCGDNKVI
ncbi:hypothetical protein ACP4OV_005491 [Aristida adscensionis]